MCGSVPKLNPPSSTFGQEILSSKRSISQSANFSATEQYCAKVCPQILTIIFVSYCLRNGISFSIKCFAPAFCNPMEFNKPSCVSATLGTGFPFHASSETPFTVIAPKRFKSINSPYSRPEPKVPDAVVTGFFNVTPAIIVSIPLFIPNYLLSRKNRAIFAYPQIFPVRFSWLLYLHSTS